MAFLLPAAFWGLLALPLLLTIYFLVGRSQTRVVSSLFLWTRQQTQNREGRRLKRPQTPLTLLLESLVLLLLVLAAARPQWRQTTLVTPLILVLDDSFSMAAGAGDSPRERAMAELGRLIDSANHNPIRFILAGGEPRLIAEEANPAADLRERLLPWRCREPSANIAAALALAGRLSLAATRLVVVTDHAPETPVEGQALEWLSLGEPRPNLAIINASRTPGPVSDRCFVQIANLTPSPQTPTLTIEAGDAFQMSIAIDPGAERSLRFEVPRQVPVVGLSLPADALAIDNHAWLVRPHTPRARVRLELKRESLAEPVRRALAAIDPVMLVEREPHLLITDRDPTPAGVPSTWQLLFPAANEGPSFIGPFAIDRRHALNQGLSLGGVIWQTSSHFQSPGFPLISAGDMPLFSEREVDGHHRFFMNFVPDGSNFQLSPNWPVLLWNLIHQRARALPGLNANNIRLGAAIVVRTAETDREIAIRGPREVEEILPALGPAQRYVPSEPGIYRVETQAMRGTVAVNALAADESDLSQAGRGTWGEWKPGASIGQRDRPLAVFFLAAALLLLTLHARLLHPRAERPLS